MACVDLTLGDGTRCLQNPFDRPSVWASESSTSLSRLPSLDLERRDLGSLEFESLDGFTSGPLLPSVEHLLVGSKVCEVNPT